MDKIQEKIETIEQRNKRVELDKAWETSFVRRGFIALVTYLIALWFMGSIGVDDAYLNALVPTGGYILSTLSLSFLKKIWTQK